MNFERVLLIYPPDSSKTFSSDAIARMEPLALEYIAACFPISEVTIRDLRIEPNLTKHLKEIKPTLVGITGYTCHANTMLSLATEIKKNDPNTIVMVGGIHASIRPQDFDVPEIDYVVMGEGTSVLSDWLLNKDDPRGIEGLAYRKDGQLVFNPPRVYPELGSLPMPKRHLVDRYRKKYVFEGSTDFAVVRTSLGCPFRCSFCCLWGLTGGRYLKRPIEQVIADLKSIPQKLIFFADDESMIDGQRMMELAQRIKKEKIDKKYYMFSRADTVVNNPKLFAAWKGIGLNTVVIGYEADSDERLERLNKKSTIDIQSKATDILREAGININAGLIVDPDFSRNDFIALKNYIRQNKFARVGVSVLTPMPGSQLFNQREYELITKDWAYYTGCYTVFPTKLSYKEFYSMYRWVQATGTSYSQKLRNLIQQPVSTTIPSIWQYILFVCQRYRYMRISKASK